MSAAERFLTFLLCDVKISDLEVLEGLMRAEVFAFVDLAAVDEDMRAERLLEKLSEVEEDTGLCLVFEGSVIPYNDSAMTRSSMRHDKRSWTW